MKTRILLLFAVCCFGSVKAKEEEVPDEEDVLDRAAIPCLTRDKKIGYCLSSSRCRRLVNNIKDPNVCFYQANRARVCCPISRSNQSPTKGPKPPPKEPTRREPPKVSFSGAKARLNVEGCGKRIFVPADGSSFVVGGREAVKHSWPWMAAIRVKTYDENTGFLCGGSLITSRHILSAAHCFESQLVGGFRQPSDFKIVLGSHYRGSDTPHATEDEEGVIIATPTNIKLHEEFDSKSNDNDIAVITLDREIPMTENIKPVCLPTRTRPENTDLVTVIGWGLTSYGGVGSKSLQEATIEVVSFNWCRRIFRSIPSIRVTDNMLCAGDLSGKKDSCQNDSGGPLLAHNKQENKWTQVGIVSFGYRCAEKGYPGLYTKVVNLVSWVERQINN